MLVVGVSALLAAAFPSLVTAAPGVSVPGAVLVPPGLEFAAAPAPLVVMPLVVMPLVVMPTATPAVSLSDELVAGATSAPGELPALPLSDEQD